MVDIVREQDQSIYTNESYWYCSIYCDGELLFSTEQLQFLLKSPDTLSSSGNTVVLDADSNGIVKDMAKFFFIRREEDEVTFWEADQPYNEDAREQVGRCSFAAWAYAIQQLAAHVGQQT